MALENLRKCPGGYKRDDVVAYIESLVKKYEKALEAAHQEKEDVRREMEAMTKENATLFKRLQEMEAERDSVSRAVISAQKEAEQIREAARAEGAEYLAQKAKEAEETEEEMRRLRREIRTMRLSAAAAIRKYEASLAELTKGMEDEEE